MSPPRGAIERTRVRVTFDLAVQIESGEFDLVYLTSPLIKGLFIAEENKDEALRRLEDVLQRLSEAAAS